MAIRQATILIRDRQVSGGALPSNALMGEPFVNLFDGVLKFSGVTGGGYEPSDVASVFEVGSTLYNSRINNRFNINDNFIISGGTGLISTYGGSSGAALDGRFLSGTTSGFVLGNISDIQGVTTRVQPGVNTYTGGTPDFPTVNIVDSPSFEDVSFSGTATGGDLFVDNLSGGTIYSGGTDLYDIFLTSGDVSGTSVSAGSNVQVQLSGNDYEVSVVDSPSFEDVSFSGIATGGDLFADNLSGGTIYSGSTDVETIIYNIVNATELDDITRVQSGVNTYTGGTANEPTVNIVDSPSFDQITTSGSSTFAGANFTGAIQSGGTDLYDIFVTEDTSDITRVQPGSNITTGGTENEPIINLVDSPSVNNFNASGTSNFTGTIQSGGTDLYSIFVNSLSEGTNINIGGTSTSPIINVVDSPNFAGLVSATGFTDSSLTDGRVVFVGASGRLVDEAGFTYDSATDTLNSQNIILGSPGKTGTTATIFGDVLIIGDAVSGFTSELYIEDNHIELNYNPTGDTSLTSLGAGFSIQDGLGTSGTEAFFDIRGTSTGAENRGFATNLNDIYIRESGTTISPGGVRVLAEFDVIDGGSWD